IAFEFFAPPPRKLLEEIADSLSHFNIQMSAESHDENVRQRFGKNYDNASLEATIQSAFELGCLRFDLFFMIGLPEQTTDSVRGTIDYCDRLLGSLQPEHVKRLHPFISPLAPFLDPGSEAFENPDKLGYRVFFRTLEDHRRAQLSPSWKYVLNYETEWMTRDEIVDSTYDAALAINRLKAKYNLVRPRVSNQIERRILIEREIMQGIDTILASAPENQQTPQIAALMSQFDPVGPYTLCDEDEMRWPTKFVRFNLLRVVRGILSRR
ncbi:MAG: TIGR04190 family B12-binding domain/radical SAM domain protein, partial [Lentisphaerae bacterium]|nr:TIGR04190 family B12-binding domain/radical SAM domain protein [Lentisphaerota bacterium]